MSSRATTRQAPASVDQPANLALTIQFLEWLDRQPRSYRETLEAWQSHCPRFTIWEDAHSLELVRVQRSDDPTCPMVVILTDQGRAILKNSTRKIE